MLRGDVAQLEEHLLCKQGVVGSSPIISTIRYSICMDKKDFQDLNDEQLSELKESIEGTIQDRARKRKQAASKKMGTKGVATAWIIIAILISVYRYLSL